MELAKYISEYCPQTLIIGIGSPISSLSTNPVFAYVGHDPGPEDLLRALPKAMSDQLSGKSCTLVSFMPAKAGSGSSTIALNTAACLAQTYRQRVLVIDADLRSSVLTAMVGFMPDTGIEVLFQQLPNSTTVDWGRVPTPWHGAHLLMSTRSVDVALPSAADYLRLLSLAVGRYDTIIVDLPELINPATLALVRASHERFVVCTPELPSLTLAPQRLSELDRLGLLNEGVGIIVNRWHRTDLDVASLTELLGQARIHTFPNDYLAVRKSFADRAPIKGGKLADAFKEFTGQLIHADARNSGIGGVLKRLFA